MNAITKIEIANENKIKSGVNEKVQQKSASLSNESDNIIENIEQHNEKVNDEQKMDDNELILKTTKNSECNLNANDENIENLLGKNQIQNDENILCPISENDINAKPNKEHNTTVPQTVELKIITTTLLPILNETKGS